MAVVDLTGRWRASLADPERRRRFSAPDLDDTDDPDWHDLEVPGHWRSTSAFAASDGPLLYRRRFDVDSTETARERFDVDSAPSGGRRWWLVLDGIFYLGDVWLDGRYLGDTEGYFFPHQFEVTDQVAAASEHLLAIEVACPPQADRTHKHNLTGSLQHSTWLDPTWNPGGIWRAVRLESSGPLRIRHARVRCVEADDDRAVLALRAVVDAAEATTGTLRTTIAPTGDTSDTRDHELHHVLAAGENRIEWTITVHQPDLWWPHTLGAQPLYGVAIEVFGSGGDRTAPASDRRQLRTGLRSIRLDRWILSVNGERLFLKGTNLGPTRQGLADATPDEVVADIAAAKDLGLDLVRVHSHIAPPELYAAADDAGMIVWQDLPLQWSYARSVRQQALRQAREAVDVLAHHPSIAIWCAHSEPLAGGVEDHDRAPVSPTRQIRQRLGQALPTWNKSVLDPSLRRTLRALDRSRPAIAGSGVLPHVPLLDGTDSHLWFGWEYGDIDGLARLAKRWPRLVRFVSELGAQAVPDSDEFIGPEKWPHLDWELLALRHGLRRDLLDRIADPDRFATFDEWRDATQAYQAELLRRQIETMRLLKYRPTGGFAQFLLADGHPAISHSLLDHHRRPKAAYDAVRAACRPVIVVASPVPGSWARNDRPTDVGVFVVSDRRHPLADATVEATVGGEAHTWTGDVPADAAVRIATLPVPGPAGREGRLVLSLRDASGAELAENSYP
jgi:beta-mannosidase